MQFKLTRSPEKTLKTLNVGAYFFCGQDDIIYMKGQHRETSKNKNIPAMIVASNDKKYNMMGRIEYITENALITELICVTQNLSFKEK